MEKTWKARSTPTSLAWPVTLHGIAVLWVWPLNEQGMEVLLGAVALVLTTILGIVWLVHTRTARRIHAALNAYAEREIERERRRNRPPKGTRHSHS